MTDRSDKEWAHLTREMLRNPAWARLLSDTRRQLSSERDRLALEDPRRAHISIAETLLTRMERRASTMARQDVIQPVQAA